MEFRHLRFFIALAEELHFTKAARRLNVAQPHLSQEIRRLESELGAALLYRTSRTVLLTEAGRVFHERAVEVMRLTDEAGRAVRNAGGGVTGRLVIGFAGSAGYQVLPDAVRHFRARWPDVQLVLKEMSTFEQIAALRESAIDVAFVRRAIQRSAGILSKVIVREPLMLAVPSGHQLARQRTVALADLAEHPWIVFDRTPNPGLFGDFHAACAAAGFEPVIAQEAGEIPTMINLVSTGLGLAMVPESVTRIRRTGVTYRPFRKPPPPSPLAVAWRKETVSPVVKNFLGSITDSVRQPQ